MKLLRQKSSHRTGDRKKMHDLRRLKLKFCPRILNGKVLFFSPFVQKRRHFPFVFDLNLHVEKKSKFQALTRSFMSPFVQKLRHLSFVFHLSHLRATPSLSLLLLFALQKTILFVFDLTKFKFCPNAYPNILNRLPFSGFELAHLSKSFGIFPLFLT